MPLELCGQTETPDRAVTETEDGLQCLPTIDGAILDMLVSVSALQLLTDESFCPCCQLFPDNDV